MSETLTKKPTPLVKWAGGKRQLQDIIKKAFDQTGWDSKNSKYFEPFFGGGALFFFLEPKNAEFSDLNSSLIALYKEAKSRPEKLLRRSKEIQDEYNESDPERQRELFKIHKDSFNSLKGKPGSENNSTGPFLPKASKEPELAALFLFLNKAGFNGMYRENGKGDFNIPFGQRSTIKLLDEQNLGLVHQVLVNVEPRCVDYSQLVHPETVRKGDLVYFDPPYEPLTDTASFNGYNKGGFDRGKQVALAERAEMLSDKGAHVFISNSSHNDMIKLYASKGFYVHGLDAKRQIAAKYTSRVSVKEILASKFPIEGLEILANPNK